ncbi:hypothetical protein R2F25_37715 [Streptomyces sp. UP1A-1]|nr:hypothetical protein [Streptomyces sp. UP1A-1]
MARQTEDRLGEARARDCLGHLFLRGEDHEQAHDSFLTALRLFRAAAATGTARPAARWAWAWCTSAWAATRPPGTTTGGPCSSTGSWATRAVRPWR